MNTHPISFFFSCRGENTPPLLFKPKFVYYSFGLLMYSMQIIFEMSIHIFLILEHIGLIHRELCDTRGLLMYSMQIIFEMSIYIFLILEHIIHRELCDTNGLLMYSMLIIFGMHIHIFLILYIYNTQRTVWYLRIVDAIDDRNGFGFPWCLTHHTHSLLSTLDEVLK